MKKIAQSALLSLGFVGAFSGGIVAAPALADQPYMRTAYGQLADARVTLRSGRTDKGGHRVRAIALVNQAMNEVRAGMNYAGY